MHPQLMRPSGQRLEREPGKTAAASHHLPCGHSRRSVRVGLHPPATLLIEFAKRNIDAAFLGGGHALDRRPIGFADLALLEKLAEQRERLAVAAEHQATGCLLYTSDAADDLL